MNGVPILIGSPLRDISDVVFSLPLRHAVRSLPIVEVSFVQSRLWPTAYRERRSRYLLTSLAFHPFKHARGVNIDEHQLSNSPLADDPRIMIRKLPGQASMHNLIGVVGLRIPSKFPGLLWFRFHGPDRVSLSKHRRSDFVVESLFHHPAVGGSLQNDWRIYQVFIHLVSISRPPFVTVDCLICPCRVTTLQPPGPLASNGANARAAFKGRIFAAISCETSYMPCPRPAQHADGCPPIYCAAAAFASPHAA